MEKENKADYGWLKSLLLSILGTFIGVGLTFYADRTVEKRQQKKAQRETAIMALTHHMKGQEEPFTMLLTRKQK